MAMYGNLDLSLGSRAAFPRPVLLKWGTTRTALGQVVCGAWLLTVGMAVAGGLLAFGNALLGLGAFGLQGVSAFGQLLTLIMYMVSVLGAVLLFVGIVTCSGSPREFGGRDYIKGTIFCFAAVAALFCADYFLEAFVVEPIQQPQHRVQPIPKVMPGPAAQDNSRLIGKLLHRATPYFVVFAGFCAGVFFLLFLRRMAQVAGEERGPAQIMAFLGTHAAVAAVFAACTYLSGRLLPALESPVYAALLLMMTAGYFGWFALLAGRVRVALTHMLLEE